MQPSACVRHPRLWIPDSPRRDRCRRWDPQFDGIREPIRTAMISRLRIVPILGWALACAGADAEPGLLVERDTVGDTMVVRTLAGSVRGEPYTLEPEIRIGVFEGEDAYMFGRVVSLAVAPDGSIYVMDAQVPALRQYAPNGSYVTTLGRRGGGPGEYEQPDGGLAVLEDERVVLRDPGNARLQVYSAAGEPAGTWSVRGGLTTSNPLTVDTAGRVYTQILLDPEANVADWRMGLVAHDPVTGEAVDTVPAPTWDFEAPRVIAQRNSEGGTSTSINSVPFAASQHWAFSPLGYMVGGVSTRYAIDQYHPDGTVTRLERVYEPVAVHPDEKADREEATRWSMRRTQPDWKWNGPPIPDRKSPFRGVNVGRDGRIWVLVSQPGQRIPDEELTGPGDDRDPNDRPPARWREPVAYDVFEPDGTYLGLVQAPSGFSTSPTPVFDGDRVWATVRDESDVQYVVRFRAVPADRR